MQSLKRECRTNYCRDAKKRLLTNNLKRTCNARSARWEANNNVPNNDSDLVLKARQSEVMIAASTNRGKSDSIPGCM